MASASAGHILWFDGDPLNDAPAAFERAAENTPNALI